MEKWQTVFNLVSPSIKLVCKSNIYSYNRTPIEKGVLQASSLTRWVDFVQLLNQFPARCSSGRRPVAQLCIDWPRFTPYSRIWEILYQPFMNYERVDLSITRWGKSANIGDDPFQLLRAFRQGQLRNIHLPAFEESNLLEAAAVRGLTSLNTAVINQEACLSLWTAVENNSQTLRSLIVTFVHSGSARPAPRTLSLSTLSHLELSEKAFSLVVQLASCIAALPSLRSITIEGRPRVREIQNLIGNNEGSENAMKAKHNHY